MNLILTCEHASNRVPVSYQACFLGVQDTLASHRGWDPGSAQMAKCFRRLIKPRPPLFQTNTTRLLVEPNRSLGHPKLFSEFTRELSSNDKQAILKKFYFPHRNAVHDWIASHVSSDSPVLHLSIHSFTPEFQGEVRNSDIGLLYDPGRPLEKAYCRKWSTAIAQARPDLKVRKNYPYRGIADGFTTWLRKQFLPDQYLGIELEVNQAHLDSTRTWQLISTVLAKTLPAS